MEEQNLQVNKKNGNFKKFIIIIFSIFAFVTALIIIGLLFLVMVFNKVQKDAEAKFGKIQEYNITNEQDSRQKAISAINKISNVMTYTYFENYEITENENKFYVLSKKWKYADFNERKQMMEFAALKAMSYKLIECENNKETCLYKPGKYDKTDELEITKIYDYETKQLLGEFHHKEKTNSSDGIIEEALTELSGYKFYDIKNN